jgi:hypothetical protein
MALLRSRALCSALVSACAIGSGAWSPALAQPVAPAAPSGDTRLVEVPVALDSIHRFHVTSLGRVIEDGPAYSPRECNRVATWTDANFGGGSFNAQAGFAQGETSRVDGGVAFHNEKPIAEVMDDFNLQPPPYLLQLRRLLAFLFPFVQRSQQKISTASQMNPKENSAAGVTGS